MQPHHLGLSRILVRFLHNAKTRLTVRVGACVRVLSDPAIQTKYNADDDGDDDDDDGNKVLIIILIK